MLSEEQIEHLVNLESYVTETGYRFCMWVRRQRTSYGIIVVQKSNMINDISWY